MNGERFAGKCVGGPLDGKMTVKEQPHFRVQLPQNIPPVLAYSNESLDAQTIVYHTITYLWQPGANGHPDLWVAQG